MVVDFNNRIVHPAPGGVSIIGVSGNPQVKIAAVNMKGVGKTSGRENHHKEKGRNHPYR
jgi:hypothetical protein